MSPRGAALILAMVLIVCGIVAAVVIGVPWPAVVAGSLLALAVAVRLVTRRRREAPPIVQ